MILNHIRFLLLGALLLALEVLSSETARAESGIRIPTVSLSADVGYFTYKSKLAASNDTGLRYGYGFQIYGGADRNLGAGMRASLLTASFALNQNKITEKNQSFVFNYRKGFVYAGAAFGTTQISFTENGTDAMDAYGNTLGGNVGLIIPFGKANLIQSDVLVLKPSGVKDSQQRTVNLGLRIEADTNMSFALSRKFIDLILGFKYVTHTATVSGVGGAESQTIPTVGFRLGANL